LFRASKEGKAMFARTLRIQIHLDKIDEAAKLFEENISPLIKDTKGNMGAEFMADRKTGNCIIMTKWENEEDLIETEHSRLFQEQIVKLMNFFITPPIRDVYEVLYDEHF
jgi:heme-degrading monooxygenase HmoA